MTLKRVVLLAWMTFLGLVLAPSAALAAVVPPDAPVALNTEAETDAFNLSPIVVIAILSIFIPIVNGIVTKLTTSSKVKAIISVALSIIAGLVTVGLTDGGGSVISKEAAIAAGISFIIQTATYVGFYKPLGLTSSAMPDGTPGKLANVGVK